MLSTLAISRLESDPVFLERLIGSMKMSKRLAMKGLTDYFMLIDKALMDNTRLVILMKESRTSLLKWD